MKKHKQPIVRVSGFTIVELMVVIVIIGTLATISVISYGNFRKSIAVAQLKSDLNNVSTAMESTRNFNNVYPATIPSTFSPTKDNSGNAIGSFSDPISYDSYKTYCVDSTIVADNTVHYYIDSTSSSLGAQLGTCASVHPAPQNVIATTVSNTSISTSWDAVSGATSYTLQRDTTPDFTSPVIVTLSTTTSVATGLTQGINYYYRVNATTGVVGGWSDIANANTNIPAPDAPSVAVTLSGNNILATATAVTCLAGTTPQYAFSSLTNGGSWSSFTSWSFAPTSTRLAVQGVNYSYKAQARCYVSDTLFGSTTIGTLSNYNYSPPDAPSVTVALSGSNILATSTAVTCSSGATTQYAFRNKTNDGSWSGYTVWGSSQTASQVATDGVKYVYQAQVRCYVDETLFGSAVSSLEATYIKPISAPSAPSVWVASVPDWATTNYSWSAAACPSGTSAQYQYLYSISGGYESGWIDIGNSTSLARSTQISGKTYYLQIRQRCVNSYATGSFGSESAPAGYYRPYTVTVLVVAGGGGGGAGDSYGNGGGGGAGGYIYTEYTVSPGGWGVGVGGGGAGGHGDPGHGVNGGNSSFNSITAIGGGGGAGGGDGTDGEGRNGGSGGGGAGDNDTRQYGGTGVSGQGNRGGNASVAARRGAGGGGGSGGEGGCGSCHDGAVAGNGGGGIWNGITGSGICYAGGGGGGIGSGTEGSGTCGGGNAHETRSGDAAAANTGGGGGGGKGYGGNGGSGIVIVRYNNATMNADGGSKYGSGSDNVHVFNSNGGFTVYAN